jgi:HrpA-like RNA helicase
MVLRDLLGRKPNLRVILMSATLDADLFHRYFGGAPSVKFPGRTFPVAELYLEHALELTQHEVRPRDDWARRGGGSGSSGAIPAGVAGPDDEALSLDELSQRYPTCSPSSHKALLALDHNAIDYALVVQVNLFPKK